MILDRKAIQFIVIYCNFIFYFIFIQRTVKFIVGVYSPKKLYHIGESEGIWSNKKNPTTHGRLSDPPKHQYYTGQKNHEKWSIFRGGAPVRFYVNASVYHEKDEK